MDVFKANAFFSPPVEPFRMSCPSVTNLLPQQQLFEFLCSHEVHDDCHETPAATRSERRLHCHAPNALHLVDLLRCSIGHTCFFFSSLALLIGSLEKKRSVAGIAWEG